MKLLKTLIIITFLLPLSAFANGDWWDTSPVVPQTNGLGDPSIGMLGARLAAADYCVMDFAPGWQGCTSAGFDNGYVGYNFALATRVDCWMIKFGVQTDEDFKEYSGGIGGSWHFGCK